MRLPGWNDRDPWHDFVAVARFFTCLPLPADATEPTELADAAWAFPVIGACIGLACALVYALADRLGLPVLASALLAIGAGTVLTGGLHEDGLADTMDGLGGSDAPTRLVIMRDSRSGAFGVLALVFSVGLRAAALAAMPGAWSALGALVAAHAVSRGILPAVMYYLPPAREDGLGAAAGRPDFAFMLWSLGLAALIALASLGIATGIAALIAASLVAWALAMLARRRIGGHTGDVLGAIEQGGETAMLLAASAWNW